MPDTIHISCIIWFYFVLSLLECMLSDFQTPIGGSHPRLRSDAYLGWGHIGSPKTLQWQFFICFEVLDCKERQAL